MSQGRFISIASVATMSILRGVAAAIFLCSFTIVLPVHAQIIEVPRETKVAAVKAATAPQVARSSRGPTTAPRVPDFVDIRSVDPTIIIDLRYATEQNVTGHALYPKGTRALVLPHVAQQLSGAQKYLHQFGYRLKIWDAYRPKEAQELLWKYSAKDQYVANPEKGFGSMHSYGVSVDVTLVDDWSQDAAMPTKFDEFTPQAMMRYAGRDPLVRQHLNLLQQAMAYNSFCGLRVEWWHFTSADWKKYVPYWEDPQMSQAARPAEAPKS
jgi:zinc D-Ala-D-Ala dipeptidase